VLVAHPCRPHPGRRFCVWALTLLPPGMLAQLD
jgi:hypothetical protein